MKKKLILIFKKNVLTKAEEYFIFVSDVIFITESGYASKLSESVIM